MKKSFQNHAFWLKIMRLSITQVFFAVIFSSMTYANEVTAQEILNKKISLNVENKEIPVLLKQIEKVSDTRFVYNSNLFNASKKVSFRAKDEKLGEVLEKLLTQESIKFEVSGKYILLNSKSIEPSKLINYHGSIDKPVADFLVSGTVTDEKGEGLPGISVMLKGTAKGTVTDMEGKFSLNVPSTANNVLVISGIGYKKVEKTISANSGNLTIVLSEDNLQLDQVVVTSAGTPKSKLESSVAVTSISSKQIDTHPPLNSMDLLKNIPGLSVESSGGDGPGAVRVRGLPAGSFAYMGVMEDGTALVPTGFVTTPSADQFYKVDLTIKNVEAVRGGDAAMILPSTAGALMNIISKTGGDKFEMQAKYVRGLAQNSNRLDLNFGGPLAPKWKYDIGGFYRVDDGIKPANYIGNQGGQIKANTTYEFKKNSYIRLYAKYLNDRVAWLVPSYYSYDGSGQGNALPYFDPLHQTLATRDYMTTLTFNGNSYNFDMSEGDHTKLFSTALEFKYSTDNEWTIRNNMKYEKVNFIFNSSIATTPFLYKSTVNYYNLDGSTFTPPTGGYYTGESFGGTTASLGQFMDNLDFSKQFGKNALSFGASLHSYSADIFSLGGTYFTPLSNNPQILRIGTNSGNGFSGVAITGYQNGSETISSLWANDETSVGKLSINLGVRADNFNVQGNRLINAAPYNTYTPFNNTNLNWTATLGLNYKIDDVQALFARATKTYAALNLSDYSNFTFNPAAVANRDVLMAELGYKLNTSNFSLFTSLVYAGLNNAATLMLVPNNTGGFINMSAFASSRNLSAEIEAILTITKNFKLRNVTTFQNSKYTDFSVTAPANAAAGIAGNTYSWAGKYPERIPDVIETITATYSVKQFDIFATYRYIGKRWSSAANLYQMGGYNETSAGIDFRASKHISLRLWGDNLLNARGLTEGNIRGDQFLANGNFAIGSPQIGRIILPRSVMIALSYSL